MRRRADVSIALEALGGSERLVPDYLLRRTEDLNPEDLKNLGYSHIIFDFDNTLTHWGGSSLPPAVQQLFESLIRYGFSILIASNGRSARFKRLSDQWSSAGITFLGRCGKPKADKIESFMKKEGWNRDTTLLIGDNLGADVGAARTIGCSVALVTPRFWLEFPLTKIWRFVEWIHRRKRAGEWASVPWLSEKESSRSIPWELILIPLVFIPVFLFHVPLARTPVPGSSLTVFHADLAKSMEDGWPKSLPQEPERSLLLSAISSICFKTFGTNWVGPLTMACLWITAACLYIIVRRTGGWIIAVTVTLIILLSPSMQSVIGEISSAPLELMLVFLLFLAVGRPILTGVLFFLLLSNGLSGIVALPVCILHTDSVKRGSIFRTVCIATTAAVLVWILIITSGAVSPIRWSADTLTFESTSYASLNMDTRNATRMVMQVEEALQTGLIGHKSRLFSFPILILVSILGILISTRTNPTLFFYLALRIGTMMVLPSHFSRALVLTLFLPIIVVLVASAARFKTMRFLSFILALMFIFAVASGARDTRRKIVTLRHTFNAEWKAGGITSNADVRTPAPDILIR